MHANYHASWSQEASYHGCNYQTLIVESVWERVLRMVDGWVYVTDGKV